MIIRAQGDSLVLPSPEWGESHEGLNKDIAFRWTYKGNVYSYVPSVLGDRSTFDFILTQEKANEVVRFMQDHMQDRWFLYEDVGDLIQVGFCQNSPNELSYDFRGAYCSSNDSVAMTLEIL